MAAKKPSKPNPAQLRDAFKTDLASCWQFACSLHPKETPYAFALHGLEGTPHLYPYVLTEEGLTQVAKRYVSQGYHETIDEARKELRYSLEDSPYSTELEDKLPNVDRLMEPIEHTLDETEGYAMLAKAAIEAFIALDKQGTFGKGKQREKLLLMIETIEAEKDWSLPSVKRLNPRVVVSRYVAQTKVEGDYVSADDLCLSADGKLLTYDGYREVDPRTGKTYREQVACDVKGLRLERRWALSSKRDGGFFSIICGPDGTVCVIDVAELEEEKYETTVTRYAKGEKSRATRVVVPGEAVGLTISPDGSRLAFTLNDKLHVLDEKLQTVAVHKAPKTWRIQKFLKSGDLLAVVNKGLITINARGQATPLPYLGEVLWTSLDAAETLCAISFMKEGLICDQKPRDQHGFKLFSFPKLKLQREFKIPIHQLTKAVISPDGKLVACEANECGKYQKFVVVYEVKSGKEVARRNTKDIGDFIFIPGQPVLAMGARGHMKKEPVIFWKVA
jgi:hypothetical protein